MYMVLRRIMTDIMILTASNTSMIPLGRYYNARTIATTITGTDISLLSKLSAPSFRNVR